jgi:hypothetical protein
VLRRQDVALAGVLAVAVLIVIAASFAARRVLARRRRSRTDQLATTAKKSRL